MTQKGKRRTKSKPRIPQCLPSERSELPTERKKKEEEKTGKKKDKFNID